ncbi:Snf7-domain-containing protein [Xylaria sp. FL0933]|nr:Snf7-domain-containing protein [Xylaria sp. FL0933]
MSELLDYLLQHDPNFRRARLPALYSDFRPQRTLNPDGFEANVSAWKRGLSNAALAGHAPSKSPARNHLILEVDDALLRGLESKQFGRPLALGTVLQEAMAGGEMIPLPQFLKATQSIYHKSWGQVPWAVAGWALRQIGLTGGSSNTMPKGQVVVVLQNLEVVAKAFSDATADRIAPFERIFSRTHFRRTFEAKLLDGQRLSDNDFDVLVKFLSRDKQVLATDGNTIKIRDPAETATISEEDSAIASLKELMEELTRQTEALSRRVDDLSLAALDAVRRKNRVSALAALKSKKLAENTLTTRHATLNQLEEVATKIQQAADNVQLVRVMESSTGALRSLNAQVGGADRVDAVLDDLREQMGQVDEVGNVIADVGADAAVVDEGEVDDEFEAMLAEERKKEDEAERVKKEAQEAKEAEETRRKLAELEKLGPTPVAAAPLGEDNSNRPLTPVTAAANVFGGMHLDTADESQKEEPEKIPTQ